MIFAFNTSNPMFMAGAFGPAMFAPKSFDPHATTATEVTLPAFASDKTCISKSMQASDAGFRAASWVESMMSGLITWGI